MPRMTDWVDTVVVLDAATGAQDFISLITGLAPVNMRGVTLVRTLVRLSLQSATVAGAWGTQNVNLAIGVASQEAFAAGTLPDPLTSGDKPPRGWVYRTAVTAAQNGVGGPVVSEIVADIRAARKIENGELFLIMNNSTALGTAFSVRVRGLVRCLFKLP